MIITIILVWVLLTYPMVRETLTQMEKDERIERNGFLFQLILVGQCMIYVPIYYVLFTYELIKKIFKKK